VEELVLLFIKLDACYQGRIESAVEGGH